MSGTQDNGSSFVTCGKLENNNWRSDLLCETKVQSICWHYAPWPHYYCQVRFSFSSNSRYDEYVSEVYRLPQRLSVVGPCTLRQRLWTPPWLQVGLLSPSGALFQVLTFHYGRIGSEKSRSKTHGSHGLCRHLSSQISNSSIKEIGFENSFSKLAKSSRAQKSLKSTLK